MQLDSHRRALSSPVNTLQQPLNSTSPTQVEVTTTTAEMPCPRSRCFKPKTFVAEDGTEMQTWYSVRREHLQNMRRMVKRVVLYMALIEAVKHAPDAIVFAGTRGYPEKGPEDYGIAYYSAYVLSYLFLCIFMVIWKPLFSWWVPSSVPSDSSAARSVDKVSAVLTSINMFLLPLSVALSLTEYVYWAVKTFIYVDAQPVNSSKLPKSTQKNWLARSMILVGVLISASMGHCMFETLAEYGLAHVKQTEYLVIVLPIQINLGVLFGSAMQWRMEKRIERKKLAVRAIEVGTIDEKEVLLTV